MQITLFYVKAIDSSIKGVKLSKQTSNCSNLNEKKKKEKGKTKITV